LASLTSFTDEALIALDTLADRASGLVAPSLRLGVTGLSRAGKTVFISAFVHNLVHGGRLPLFEAQKSGRIARAFLEHQPDDAVPRFQYEDHVAALVSERAWPDSTRAISELRLTIQYESASGWGRLFSSGKLSVDIVDYPGEWLLDLPLLGKDFRAFSTDAFELAELPVRADISREWRKEAAAIDPAAPFEEMTARRLAETFTAYLRACKADHRALSTLPPGRFLMPGDLDGSPALTFAPLPDLGDGRFPSGSLAATMERRYEAYKTHVVKPFFREHIARLDRQIVLIDALQALNAGPGNPRLFPARARRHTDRPFLAPDRPHPRRRDQGRPSPSRKPRPPAGDRPAAGGPRGKPGQPFRRQRRRAGDGGGARHARRHCEAGA
jgi:predicted YcjX-like family ATPase